MIAEKLQVDRRTVYNWRLRKEKEIDWKRRKQKGATSRLSEKQKEKLKKIIDDGATACGYPTEVWTLKRIAEVIEKEYLGVHNDRLITRRIPAYSPELNPDEFVWNALKYQELPNFCPKSYDELYNTAENTLVKMKANPRKMKRIIRGTKLPLPSTLGK